MNQAMHDALTAHAEAVQNAANSASYVDRDLAGSLYANAARLREHAAVFIEN